MTPELRENRDRLLKMQAEMDAAFLDDVSGAADTLRLIDAACSAQDADALRALSDDKLIAVGCLAYAELHRQIQVWLEARELEESN